ASIVDQNRRLTEMLLDMLERGGLGFVAGNVQHQPRALNAIVLQGFGDSLGAGRRRSGTDDDRALTAQFKGDRLADTSAGTGYQRHFALQTHNLLLVHTNAPRAAAKASGVSRL